MSTTYIIIPVFNENTVIRQVINKIKRLGYKKIIVVDDGSEDQSYEVLKKERITLLRHVINCGKGAAIKTGIEAAKILKADFIITIDGDGQHDAQDLKKIHNNLLSGYDVVLGYRQFHRKDMPITRIIANHFANIVTWLLYGIRVRDSQSGLRGYTKNAFQLINTNNNRYEYDSEVIKEIAKHKLRYVEVPIQTYYTNYSLHKKQKQNFSNAIYTFYKMVVSI